MLPARRTARQIAREELTRQITDEARRQLSETGAAGLSLRNVAKTLGMSSSAVYRYFPSKDDLLTRLVIDAYDSLGEAAEKAEAKAVRAGEDLRGRWRATCRAVRTWARRHPQEYGLIYGSPVPGYQAPQDTIEPATRVGVLLIRLVAEAQGTAEAERGKVHDRGEVHDRAEVHDRGVGGFVPARPLAPVVARQSAVLGDAVGVDLPVEVLYRAAQVWTHLFGTVPFELFGQYANVFDPADAYFDAVVEDLADLVGLAPARTS